MRAAKETAVSDAREFALVDLGSLSVGVSTDAVVQAIPRPTELTRLPRAGGELVGVFSHQGRVVPLINLDTYLGAGTLVPERLRQALILRAGDKLVGVLVHALKGLWKVPAAEVRRIHHEDTPQELFHSVAFGEDRTQLISLLDASQLAARAQVWSQEAEADTAHGPSDGVAATRREGGLAMDPIYSIVRVGPRLLGFAATLVGEVMRCTDLQKMTGLGREFVGITRWRARDVPVLDLAQLLGMGDTPRSSQWQVVLDLEGRCAAFYADEICAVRAFAQSRVQPQHDEGGAFAAFVSGSVVADNGERIYLLDAEKILAASPLSAAPAQQQAPAGALLQIGLEQPDGDGALVVVQSRQSWALPMHQLREILPAPAQWLPCANAQHHVVGGMEWRGKEIPVIDLGLATRACATVPGAQACVVLADVNQRQAALLVENLLALIPEHAGSRSQFRAHGRMVRMATVGMAEQQQSYQILDVATLGFFGGSASGDVRH